VGRPSKYTDALALTICKRIAEGESLNKICKDAKMPSIATVFNWLRRHDDFLDKYQDAREAQADGLFDKIVDLSDEADKDNATAIRVRIWARQWVLARMIPKKYGDKQAVEVTGAEGGPVQIVYDKSFDGL